MFKKKIKTGHNQRICLKKTDFIASMDAPQQGRVVSQQTSNG